MTYCDKVKLPGHNVWLSPHHCYKTDGFIPKKTEGIDMNEVVALPGLEIEQRIFMIREMRVMLSIDLADIY